MAPATAKLNTLADEDALEFYIQSITTVITSVILLFFSLRIIIFWKICFSSLVNKL